MLNVLKFTSIWDALSKIHYMNRCWKMETGVVGIVVYRSQTSGGIKATIR